MAKYMASEECKLELQEKAEQEAKRREKAQKEQAKIEAERKEWLYSGNTKRKKWSNHPYYNFVPETFVSQDSNLKFTVSESAKKVTIENLSTNSIVVNSIPGYFNGGVDENIFDAGSGINRRQTVYSIFLPPKTSKTLSFGYIDAFDWRANLARNFISNYGFIPKRA